MVFNIFGSLSVKKFQKKFLFASMKSLIYCESPFSNPPQGASSGSPIIVYVNLYVVSKAACDPENSP